MISQPKTKIDLTVRRHRNGIIEGYKVYYGAKGVPFRFKTVEGNATRQTTLTELRKFAKYAIQVKFR